MTEKLSGVLAAIESIAGLEAAAEFSCEFGGREFHVPSPDRLHPRHPFRGYVWGMDVAARFSGETVYVPLARRLVVPWLAARGHSTDRIAARLGISAKTVRRYLRDGGG